MTRLVKAHNSMVYLEDFGLTDGHEVFLYENGTVEFEKICSSPVVRINALWVDKPVKIKCKLADTEPKKRKGLQGVKKLGNYEGMFFPYFPEQNVAFHQGSVEYPLDIIFFDKDSKIIKIKQNTKVGSFDKYSCKNCACVIELLGGFCKRHNVKIGDRVSLCAISELDVEEFEKEAIIIEQEKENKFVQYNDDVLYEEYSAPSRILSFIADEL